MESAIGDGLTLAKILSRLREKELEAGLTLQYIQRYKTNHKAAALRFEGFLGTVQKHRLPRFHHRALPIVSAFELVYIHTLAQAVPSVQQNFTITRSRVE